VHYRAPRSTRRASRATDGRIAEWAANQVVDEFRCASDRHGARPWYTVTTPPATRAALTLSTFTVTTGVHLGRKRTDQAKTQVHHGSTSTFHLAVMRQDGTSYLATTDIAHFTPELKRQRTAAYPQIRATRPRHPNRSQTFVRPGRRMIGYWEASLGPYPFESGARSSLAPRPLWSLEDPDPPPDGSHPHPPGGRAEGKASPTNWRNRGSAIGSA